MSPQLSYAQNPSAAVAGQKIDIMFDDVNSFAAEETILFGLGVVGKPATTDVCKLPGANVIVVTDSGGTWTAGDVVTTINGVTVTTSFSADKATSMAAIATALQALDFVSTAVYTGGSNIITITAATQVHLSVAVDVSGITGTMTITSIVGTSSDRFLGLSIRDVREEGSFRNRNNDQVILTLSGDTLTTSDTVTATINGVTGSTVTYATSEANTLQLLANSILSIAGVANAVVSGRTITVTNNPGLLMEKASVAVVDNALASVAPSFAPTYSQQANPLAVNATAYLASETVNVLRKGRVWVRVEEAIALGNTVFMRINTGTGAQKGAFRNDADSGTCVEVAALTFIGPSQTAPDGTLVAPVEINQP
jgi:hypothetical protein